MGEHFHIEKYFNDHFFINATLLQLEKDFSECGLQIEFQNRNYQGIDELIQHIAPALENIMTKNFSSYLNLLYRIDLPESRIRKETGLRSNEPLNFIIAELIIKRELQKVVIKEMYIISVYLLILP